MKHTELLNLDYELLDFGNGRKLERFGELVLDRPEILALDPCVMSREKWQSLSGATFQEKSKQSGSWKPSGGIPEEWRCGINHPNFALSIKLKPGRFKHIGVFPEQEYNWRYLAAHLNRGDKFLNLFAYTGVSSLVAAATGADVFHVDSSRSVVNWAAQNAELNGMDRIHWVCEDALKFAGREVRRGHRYKAIIMDPPIYGKGASGEHWRLEDKLLDLVKLARNLLIPGGFVIVNTYSPQLSLEDMREICIKSGLLCNDKGWLSVCSRDGRKLQLSKYVLGSAGY